MTNIGIYLLRATPLLLLNSLKPRRNPAPEKKIGPDASLFPLIKESPNNTPTPHSIYPWNSGSTIANSSGNTVVENTVRPWNTFTISNSNNSDPDISNITISNSKKLNFNNAHISYNSKNQLHYMNQSESIGNVPITLNDEKTAYVPSPNIHEHHKVFILDYNSTNACLKYASNKYGDWEILRLPINDNYSCDNNEWAVILIYSTGFVYGACFNITNTGIDYLTLRY